VPWGTIRLIEKAIRCDPWYAFHHLNRFGRAYDMLRQYDGGVAVRKRIIGACLDALLRRMMGRAWVTW